MARDHLMELKWNGLNTSLLTLMAIIFIAGCGGDPLDAQWGDFESPGKAEEQDVLIRMGTAAEKCLHPPSIKVISWNMHKAVDENFYQTFAENIHKYHIAAMQEVFLKEDVINALPRITHELNMATSFSSKHGPKGVGTLSTAASVATSFFRSPDPEPFSDIHKMSVMTEYSLCGAEKNLVVVNSHGINFVTRGTLKKQLRAIAKGLNDHDGPILWVGDFNTWTDPKLEVLNDIVETLGLAALTYDEDLRKTFQGRPLDHLYYRGLDQLQGTTLKWDDASDHYPISAEFSYR